MGLKIFKRPDLTCLIIIPFVIILGLIAGTTTLDIQLYTTYYVLKYHYISAFAVSLLIISSLVYRLIIRNKSNVLTKFHLPLVITGILVLMLIAAITGGTSNGRSIGMDMTYSYTIIVIILIAMLGIIVGNLAFLMNILKTIFESNR